MSEGIEKELMYRWANGICKVKDNLYSRVDRRYIGVCKDSTLERNLFSPTVRYSTAEL
jgi:hypothetical protein